MGSQLATGFNLEPKIGFACMNLRQRCLLGTGDHLWEWEMRDLLDDTQVFAFKT